MSLRDEGAMSPRTTLSETQPCVTDRQLIAHLLRRAGFGATPAELDFYAGLGFDAAVERLVTFEAVDNSALETALAAKSYDLTQESQAATWWLYRMLFTARPLEEKMTLFWHDHFACNNAKVANTPYMVVQNNLFRANALGNFADLVLKVAQDPAMLVFLDGRDNVKSHPNENFARELMELFTLGIGNYTEKDVTEGARCFTGWTISNDRFFNNVRQHDAGTKTFLGQTGNFAGEDVCRIVCQQAACPIFIARKLIKYFVTDSPSDDYVARMADVFRSSGLDVRTLVAAILRSPEFKDPANVRGLVKSPVELLVGAMKHLNVQVLPSDFWSTLRQMQQELFEPPGVDGWHWGEAWISTTTFLFRANFAQRLTSGTDQNKQPFIDPVGIVNQAGLTTNAAIVDYFVDRLLDGDMTADGRQVIVDWLDGAAKTSSDRLRRLRGAIHLILTSATYQLN